MSTIVDVRHLKVKQFFNKENKPPIAIPIPISIPTPWTDLPLYITNTEFQDTNKKYESKNPPSSTYHQDIVQCEGIQIFYGCEG